MRAVNADGEEAARFERLTELMEQIGAGDQAAIFGLYNEFGGRLALVCRRMLRRRGVEAISRHDLDGLVVDACFALAEVAAAWRPEGGALPWTWARHRLENVVQRSIGQHTDELDEERMITLADQPESPFVPGGEPEPLELLHDLADGNELCCLLREALGRSGTERDQRLLLEVQLQQSLGDRSPAVTVAGMFDMSSDAVRQQVRRMRVRLRRLVEDEPRFAALADLPLVA
jgi:DNA-directed RNA polymerase specialized sigma24 family protein